MGDLKSFLARFCALRQSIIDDGIVNGVTFHSNDLRVISERILQEGTSFAKVTLPLLGKALDQGLVSGAIKCPAHFRLKRNTCLPMLCYSVFRSIFEDDGNLLDKPNLMSIQFLRQFLLLDSKLVYEPTQEMKDATVASFVQRQELLRKVKIQRDHPVLLRAQQLLGRVLRDLSLSSIVPGHGPGAVAEKLDRFERWDFNHWPVKAERYYPYNQYGIHSFVAQCSKAVPVKMVKTTYTRCCLVPKDFKGPRLISAEGVVNQYLQQGQMKSIMSHIRHHRLLSRSIRLEDQTFNQKMCREAFGRDLATLDLSNASDTVSVPLVWFLFAKVPKLRAQIFSTRSDYMKYNNQTIRLAAFAPMGSATCFPIETLVFWAISFASIQLVTHRQGLTALSDSEIASSLAVFGDDIIIPNDVLDTLISTLQSVGCSPNMSKTCRATPFRESCGSEWYSSTDITIIRNRRYQYDADKKLINVPILLDLQRKFFLQGYFNTAALLCEWSREIYPLVQISLQSIPRLVSRLGRDTLYQGNLDLFGRLDVRRYFVNSFDGSTVRAGSVKRSELDSGEDFSSTLPGLELFIRNATPFDTFGFALGWNTSLDSGVPVRYNSEYQRNECRFPSLFQRTREWSTSGYPRLMARLVGDSVERIAIRNLRLKMAWSVLPF